MFPSDGIFGLNAVFCDKLLREMFVLHLETSSFTYMSWHKRLIAIVSDSFFGRGHEVSALLEKM